MFDEDNEKRFPRITLWQFTKSLISTIFLATGWLAGLGSGLWSLLVLWIWSDHAEAQFEDKGRTSHESRKEKQAKEKGSTSEP